MTVRKIVLVAVVAPALALAGGHAAKKETTGDQAIQALKDGNARFVAGKARHPDQGLARVKELAAGQTPFAAVLGCADSRVPPELLFDQGFGDLFVVRVAGNVADPVDIGSVEYAAEHLGVPAIVILGHHGCGAVKATADAVAKGQKVEGNLGAIVAEIAPAVDQAGHVAAREGLVNDAVHANARRTAAALVERSPLIRELVEHGRLKIVPAVYDLDTGTIEWP
jgi:carbonic anhydrase